MSFFKLRYQNKINLSIFDENQNLFHGFSVSCAFDPVFLSQGERGGGRERDKMKEKEKEGKRIKVWDVREKEKEN